MCSKSRDSRRNRECELAKHAEKGLSGAFSGSLFRWGFLGFFWCVYLFVCLFFLSSVHPMKDELRWYILFVCLFVSFGRET